MLENKELFGVFLLFLEETESWLSALKRGNEYSAGVSLSIVN
jgi:hypothetical protein